MDKQTLEKLVKLASELDKKGLSVKEGAVTAEFESD